MFTVFCYRHRKRKIVSVSKKRFGLLRNASFRQATVHTFTATFTEYSEKVTCMYAVAFLQSLRTSVRLCTTVHCMSLQPCFLCLLSFVWLEGPWVIADREDSRLSACGSARAGIRALLGTAAFSCRQLEIAYKNRRIGDGVSSWGGHGK